jgi:hypothetical protein
MDFYSVLGAVEDLLRSRGRVSYRALRLHFSVDDEQLDALKAELLYAHSGAVTDDGQVLVWMGASTPRPDAELLDALS